MTNEHFVSSKCLMHLVSVNYVDLEQSFVKSTT